MQRSTSSPQSEVILTLPRSQRPIGALALEELLRQLLTQLDAQAALIERSDPDEIQPLLDVQVRGRRYAILLRAVDGAPEVISLSPRESEIVRLVARGYPNKAIGMILEISQWTVATHVRRIFAKLEATSRAEMVAKALHMGLLSEDTPI